MPCTIIDSYKQAPPAPQVQTIGSNGSTESIYPMYMYYKYGYFAFLYTNTELGGAKQITKIAFNMLNTAPNTYTVNNQSLTFFHANENQFPTNLRNNMTSLSTTWSISNETTVKSNFSWTITSADTWYEITLDTPFNYNGTDNLIIRWFNNFGTYLSGTASNPTSYGDYTGSFLSYNDYSDYITDVPLTGYGTRDSTFRPQIRITYI